MEHSSAGLWALGRMKRVGACRRRLPGPLLTVLSLLLALALATAGDVTSPIAVAADAEAATGAQFVAAVANSSVQTLLLTANIQIEATAWPVVPINRSANFTVVGVDFLPILDLAFVESKIQLLPGVAFTFKQVELRNARMRSGFELDIFPASPGASVRYDNMVYHCLSCLPVATIKSLMYQLPAATLPTNVTWTTWCRTQPPLRACFGNDRVLHIWTASSVLPQQGLQGLTSTGGYMLEAVNVLFVCEDPTTEECGILNGYDFCVRNKIQQLEDADRTWQLLAGAVPPPPGATDGGGGGDANVGAIVGGVVGGVGLLAVITVAFVWTRQRRRQQGAGPSGKGLATAGICGGAGAAADTSGESGRTAKMVEDPEDPEAPGERKGAEGTGVLISSEEIGSEDEAHAARSLVMSLAAPANAHPTPVPPPPLSSGPSDPHFPSPPSVTGFSGHVHTPAGPTAGKAANPNHDAAVAAAAVGAVGGTAGSVTIAGTLSTLGESLPQLSSFESSAWPGRGTASGGMMAAAPRSCDTSKPVVVVAGITIELMSAIGTGSFGKVFRGSWQGSSVAVKVLQYGSELCRAVHNEVLLSQTLRHPNVVSSLYFAQVLPGGRLGLQTSGAPSSANPSGALAGSGVAAAQVPGPGPAAVAAMGVTGTGSGGAADGAVCNRGRPNTGAGDGSPAGGRGSGPRGPSAQLLSNARPPPKALSPLQRPTPGDPAAVAGAGSGTTASTVSGTAVCGDHHACAATYSRFIVSGVALSSLEPHQPHDGNSPAAVAGLAAGARSEATGMSGVLATGAAGTPKPDRDRDGVVEGRSRLGLDTTPPLLPLRSVQAPSSRPRSQGGGPEPLPPPHPSDTRVRAGMVGGEVAAEPALGAGAGGTASAPLARFRNLEDACFDGDQAAALAELAELAGEDGGRDTPGSGRWEADEDEKGGDGRGSASLPDVLSRWDEQRRRQALVEQAGTGAGGQLAQIAPALKITRNGFLLPAESSLGGGAAAAVSAVRPPDHPLAANCPGTGATERTAVGGGGESGAETTSLSHKLAVRTPSNRPSGDAAADGAPAGAPGMGSTRPHGGEGSAAGGARQPGSPAPAALVPYGGPSTAADAAAAALPIEALWLAAHTQASEGTSHGFLVMELCEGGSAFVWRSAHWSGPEERPDLSVILRIALDIAYGMSYIHCMGICHGDLKLSNVLLARSSDEVTSNGTSVPNDPNDLLAGWVAKVCDFGLSRVLTGDRTHVSTRPYGTPTHMAPELWTKGHMSQPADVYAFGITLWELATGERPYKGLNAARILHRVLLNGGRPVLPLWLPPSYTRLVTSCWAQSPKDRPTFGEIVRHLEAMLAVLAAVTPRT